MTSKQMVAEAVGEEAAVEQASEEPKSPGPGLPPMIVLNPRKKITAHKVKHQRKKGRF